MNEIENVKLYFSEEIIFPDLCVYCGKENPDGTIPLSPKENDNESNGRMIVFAVPSCSSCAYAQRDKERQRANTAFTFALVIFTGIAMLYLNGPAILFYLSLAVCLIALFSSMGALKNVKSAIEIKDLNTSTISFNLSDRKYHGEFFRLNERFAIEQTPLE